MINFLTKQRARNFFIKCLGYVITRLKKKKPHKCLKRSALVEIKMQKSLCSHQPKVCLTTGEAAGRQAASCQLQPQSHRRPACSGFHFYVLFEELDLSVGIHRITIYDSKTWSSASKRKM